MASEHLFYDSPEDAISVAIQDSGKTFKEVAAHIWPALKLDTAYARLKNCLNVEKDEKLSFGEILLICKFTGHFDPIHYACDELMLHRPTPKAPADEQQELLLTIQKQQAALLATMQRLERTQIRSVA